MRAAVIYFLAVSFALTIVSCKKEKPAPVPDEPTITTEMAAGLPPNHTAINGYLYCSFSLLQYSTFYQQFFYSAFSDPTRNLMAGYNHVQENFSFNNSSKSGNIDVGEVEFNGSTILNRNIFSNSVTYNLNSGSNPVFNPSASWRIEGNGAFKAFNLPVTRGFPLISQTYSPTSISKSAGYEFTVSPVVSNFDSLVISIGDGNTSLPKVRKGVLAGATSVSFTPADLSPLYISTYGTFHIYAYNYSNKTIENKVYVFELSHKMVKYVAITN